MDLSEATDIELLEELCTRSPLVTDRPDHDDSAGMSKRTTWLYCALIAAMTVWDVYIMYLIVTT